MLRGITITGFLICAACLVKTSIAAETLHFAQYDPQQNVDVGSILVAHEKLGDPNFAESVVLIVQHDQEEGTLGLVINRPTDVTLARVFPDIKHAPADPIYMGGPVGTTVGQALLRLTAKKDDATQISGDVYVTASRKLIEKSVASAVHPSRFRLFFGYAGWAPGQLEAEIRLGAWSVLRGESKIIFDDDPESLWERLIRQTHWQMARAASLQRLQIDKTNTKQPSRIIEIESVMHAREPRACMAAVQHHIVD